MRTFQLSVLILVMLATGASSQVIDCLDGSDGGDRVTRGFYCSDYPGTTIERVDLHLSAESAGEYVIRMTIRTDTYNGLQVGQAEATVTLPGGPSNHVLTSFLFPSTSVAPHALLTFALEEVSGPDLMYYAPTTSNSACPITQTNGTTPPLDTFRRNGVRVAIHGAGLVTNDDRSWSMIKQAFR